MKRMISALAGTTMLVASGAAWAQTMATATTDLNMRAGPDPRYEVVGVIKGDDSVTINGCLEGSKWCRVTYQGREGWAYSDYLTAELSGNRVVVTERRTALQVPVATYEGGTAAGAVTGAVAGALIGGPIGAVVGGAVGASAGGMIDPPERVRTYVTSNPVDPIYLEGEVVVGARLPETVTVRSVPDYEYRYAYINGVPVLVGNERQIVYVVRR